MSIKRLYTTPNDDNILRAQCSEVKEINQEVKETIKNLFDTLNNNERKGVGLAAPQIGVNLKITVLEYEGDICEDGQVLNKIPTTVLINPTISKYSKEKSIMDEGCFSVPELYGPVERPRKIKVSALNEKGEIININASGYFARVLQHEIDHLNGILFTDYVEKGKLFKVISNEKGDKTHEC